MRAPLHHHQPLVKVIYWLNPSSSALMKNIFIFEKWVPHRGAHMGAHRVPISPKGIRGPEGARKKKKTHEVEPSEYVHLHAYSMHTSMHTPAPKGQ